MLELSFSVYMSLQFYLNNNFLKIKNCELMRVGSNDCDGCSTNRRTHWLWNFFRNTYELTKKVFIYTYAYVYIHCT